MSPIRNEDLWKRRGPAHRVIEAFGGTRALARAIGVSPAAVTRWLYPRPQGSEGLIPTARLMDILTAAAVEGIVITDSMIAPRYEDAPAQPQPVKELRLEDVI